jgi:hypothetical protein
MAAAPQSPAQRPKFRRQHPVGGFIVEALDTNISLRQNMALPEDLDAQVRALLDKGAAL